MIDQTVDLIRQSILRTYFKYIDDATRKVINDETNSFKLILFIHLEPTFRGMNNKLERLCWIMHNVSNGLAGAFMNLPQDQQSYDYLVRLHGTVLNTLTEAHTVVFRVFPDSLKTVMTLQQLVKIKIKLSHAWAFRNLQTSDPIKTLEELSNIAVSKDLDLVFCNLNPREQTIENFRLLSGKVLEHHVLIFLRLRDDFKTIKALNSLLHHNLAAPDYHYLAVFAAFPMRERTPETFNKLITLKFSEWQAVRFVNLPPQLTFREKTFSEFNMMLPSPLNAFNVVFNEAMLTTVIRQNVVPILKISFKYYNISEYDQVVYYAAPIISKAIVVFAPAEIVTTCSGYVLRSGLPDSYEEIHRVGMLFIASGFLSAVPKFYPIMQCLSVINSLCLANSMVSEQKSINDILVDMKNNIAEPVSLGSFCSSVAYYGFGLTTTVSFVWGFGIFAATTVVIDIFEYCYQSHKTVDIETLETFLLEQEIASITAPGIFNVSDVTE